MSHHSDYHEYGFNYKEISDFLAERSVSLGARHSPDPVTGYPKWAYELAAINSFTVNQTRVLLVGCDPFDNFLIGEELRKDLAIADHMLWDAIESGSLSASKKPNGDDVLKQEDIRAWCESIGRAWCIPLPEKPNVTKAVAGYEMKSNDVLWDRMQQSEREKVRLQTENTNLKEKLELAQRQISTLQKQLEEAADKLIAETKSKSGFQSEFDALKADALEGKTKSILLKLLGGMAMIGAEIDIHATRIQGIKQTTDDLALKGVGIDEDTLRKRLKEAAALISNPRKKTQ